MSKVETMEASEKKAVMFGTRSLREVLALRQRSGKNSSPYREFWRKLDECIPVLPKNEALYFSAPMTKDGDLDYRLTKLIASSLSSYCRHKWPGVYTVRILKTTGLIWVARISEIKALEGYDAEDDNHGND